MNPDAESANRRLFTGAPRFASRNRIVLSALAAVAFFAFARPTPAGLGLGILIVISGQGIRFWASGTIDKNEGIASTGPYSISRNPLYIGNFLIGLGFVTAGGRFLMLIFFLAFFFVLYRKTIEYEEEFLKAMFPQPWAEYAARVPRFLSLRSFAAYKHGEHRWERVARHREWRNIPVILLAFSLLVVRYWLAGN